MFRVLKRIQMTFSMMNEYAHDFLEYNRWNYNNPRVKTLASYEAKILRQTHVLEKGLSLSNPRKGFGKEKIAVLLLLLKEYISMGFPTENIPFQNAIEVLNQYVRIQKEMNYSNDELNKELGVLMNYRTINMDAGISHTTLDELCKEIKSEFPLFFNSRHSLRQFSDRMINIKDVHAAVKLAQKSPTACNRQACKVYYYDDEKTNKELGKLISGNTGFEDEVKNYLVVTSDMSAFYDSFERNQIYVEAGIFTMGLIEALHYYGIASCVLQNGEYFKKNKRIKTICKNIPKNEKIILFIAIGYYKDEFNYAISARKSTDSILIIK